MQVRTNPEMKYNIEYNAIEMALRNDFKPYEGLLFNSKVNR